MKLEEQLRNDAQSLAELGWFNRADMMKAAADEIQRLEQRIKWLEEEVNDLKGINAAMAMDAAMYEYRGERIKRLDGHIERLESIGDSLFDGVTRIEAEQRWRKAKEAKP